MDNGFLAKEYIWENKLILISIIFIGVLNSIITFLLPVSIGNFIILRYGSEGGKERLLQLLGIHFTTLTQFFLFFFLLIAAKALLGTVEKFYSFREGERFVKNVREQLFKAQLNTSAEVFSQRSYGYYLLRYSNDLKTLRNYLVNGKLDGWKNFSFLCVGISLLFLLHFKLSLFLLGFFLIAYTGIFLFSRYQKTFIVSSRSRRSNLLAYVTKSFSRHEKIRQKFAEEKTIDRFNFKSEQLFEANMKNNKLESLLENLMAVLEFTILGILLWISTLIKPILHHSDALVFILVTLMLLSSLRRIMKVPGYLNKGNISIRKIEKLLIVPVQSAPNEIDEVKIEVIE